MPDIDRGLNPTAVNDEKKSAGFAGFLFLLISLLFLLRTFRKEEKESS